MTTPLINKQLEIQASDMLRELLNYVPTKRDDLTSDDLQAISNFRVKLTKDNKVDEAEKLVSLTVYYETSLLKIQNLTQKIELYQGEIKSLMQEVEELGKEEINTNKWLQSGSLFTKVVSYMPGPAVALLGLAGVELTLPISIGIVVWYLTSKATGEIDSTLKLDESHSPASSKNDEVPITSRPEFKQTAQFAAITLIKQVDNEAPISKLTSELILHYHLTPELSKQVERLQDIREKYLTVINDLKQRLEKKAPMSIMNAMIPSASSMASFSNIPVIGKYWATKETTEEPSKKEEEKPKAE